MDLYEGVEETLKALNEVYLLGVITNGNANVKKIGLDAYFDVVVSSESANSRLLALSEETTTSK